MSNGQYRQWKVKGRYLSLEKPVIMGILNVTPDSFSDGGKYSDSSRAIEHGRKLIEEGAQIIDVGGESTRPGSEPVSLNEELDRVIPVIEALVAEGAIVSVDTSKAAVMKEAVETGVHIINDVNAFREEGAVEIAALSGCGLCVMHMLGKPKTMQQAPIYKNTVEDIKEFFVQRISLLEKRGCHCQSIVLDPGFGFGKTVGQNFELVAKVKDFLALGYPLLYGMSRKSSLGIVTNEEKAASRVVSSVVAHLIAIQKGVSIVRVHDVKAMKEAITIQYCIDNYKELMK